jgi:exonuclease SbcC
MKRINKIEFQNFKSYGNKKQVLYFDDEGGLILLSGKNGSGKSTIRDVIDLTAFNKVPGKRKKFTPLKKLPNRHNKCLYSSINITSKNDDNIEIKRWIEPDKISVTINDLDQTAEYKKYSQEQKDELIGYNYDTFKSFISMSMNDFKNFIVLEKSEKTNLLNKLFNIEKIDSLVKYTKDYTKQLNNKLELNGERINTKTETKGKLENIIKNVKNSENETSIPQLKEDGKKLIQELTEKKETLKTKKEVIANYEGEFRRNKIQENEKIKEIDELNFKIDDLKEKIEHYDKGECPFCETKLDKKGEKSKELEDKLSILNQKKTIKVEVLEKMQIELGVKSNKISLYKKEALKIEEKIRQITIEIKEKKSQIQNIREKKEIVDIDKINEEYNSIKEEIYDLQKKNQRLLKKKKVYLKLIDILERNETKTKIVKNSLIPINNYIKEFSEKTNSAFKVQLNEEFDAIINEREEIDPELLSTGEDKKINIIIALSYLCFILDKNKTNILFIDELFNSIDKDNIDLLLKLLEEISLKYKINIIVVHHYLDIMDLKYFKKIIQVEKNIFSDLKIKT